jgi:male germ cell-associated kinase
MDKYKVLKSLGEGTFGAVMKAVNNTTNEVVAIKKLKTTQSWEEATQQMEIKALKKLSNHANIIKIYELIRKNEAVYIVQEFCQRSLLNEIDARNQSNKPFTEHEIKLIIG